MIKAIRVENADTSAHKVMVQVLEKGRVLESGSVEPDALIREIAADYPTAMVTEYVHSSRYLVIKEVG